MRDPEYGRRHRRVRKARGAPVLQMCVGDGCIRRGYGWAHIHDTDPDNPDNYQAMCQSCHMKYDKVGERVAKALTGRKISGRQLEAALENCKKNPWGWDGGRSW